MKEKDFLDLIAKYKQGNLTPEEKQTLFNWYNAQLSNKNFDAFNEKETVQHLRELDKRFSTSKRKKLTVWSYAAAIALFILGSWGILQLLDKSSQEVLVEEADIAAPSIKAYAFLTNGDSILLDGEVNTLKSINLSDKVVGELSRDDETSNLWITIKTPKSGKFQFMLPDGSAVWLNTDSELSYPQTFGDDSREVKLIGEAYFEVTKQQDNDQSIPFIVRSNQQDVKVLGTKFNVNAYPNEPVSTTTLLEGAVEVNDLRNTGSILLRPNEQSIISATGITKNQVHATDITAWMDGYLVLRGLDLSNIARIVERNYDVTFLDKNLPTDIKMSGELQTDVQLSDLLSALQINTGVKFIRKGRSIMVER